MPCPCAMLLLHTYVSHKSMKYCYCNKEDTYIHTYIRMWIRTCLQAITCDIDRGW